jgi:hypothetical protein
MAGGGGGVRALSIGASQQGQRVLEGGDSLDSLLEEERGRGICQGSVVHSWVRAVEHTK